MTLPGTGAVRGLAAAGFVYSPVYNGCSGTDAVYRTNPATGNSTLVASGVSGNASGLTMASDGYLYSAAACGCYALNLYRIDPLAAVVTTIKEAGTTSAAVNSPASIAYSGGALWLYQPWSSYLYDIPLSSMKVSSTYTISGSDGDALTATGSYLYLTASSGHKVEQFNTANGTVTLVAGSGSAGAANGAGSAATFSGINGLASDGTGLWVSDGGNNQLRHIS